MSGSCLSCHAVNPVGFLFCGACGLRLALPLSSDAGLEAGERRQMTVMFADLVGSTRLSARLDAEEYAEVVARHRAAVTASVLGFGGVVISTAGDGMLVGFGYPVGDAEAPLQAVRAGLDAVRAIGRLRHAAGRVAPVLEIRVGIATGLVVASLAGEPSASELAGSTLNLASRLQSIAAPNEVVLSASTASLVRHGFQLRPSGPHTLPGFDMPIEAHVALSEIVGLTRLSLRLRDTTTPMVNRTAELTRLETAWAEASAGRARFVLVVADAGIGKSRLAQTLLDRIAAASHRSFAMQCCRTLRHTALHPLIELVGRLAGFAPDDDGATRLQRLQCLLEARGIDDPMAEALVASCLGIAGVELPQGMSAQRSTELRFEALTRLLLSIEPSPPLLLIVEDLHWADPATLDWLASLPDTAGSKPLMLLATSRVDLEHRQATMPALELLPLGRLDRADSDEVVSRVVASTAGSEPPARRRLPRRMVDGIVARTDGVPLFIEEMTRMVMAAGGRGNSLALPDTLRDLLTERLDRLGAAKSLAQVGAVIGREFSVALAAAVAGVPRETIAADVRALLDAELVEESDRPDTLSFRHALMQEAAYGSILKRRARTLHRRAANALIGRVDEQVAIEPEQVARHLDATGEKLDAAAWWLRAGRAAIDGGSPAAATAHLRAGLHGIAEARDDEERRRVELSLLMLLGPAQMILAGPAGPDYAQVWQRARTLMRGLPDRPGEFAITYGLALHSWARADFAAARRLAELLSTIAPGASPEGQAMASRTVLALVAFHEGAGTPREPGALLEASVGMYRAEAHREFYDSYLMDFGVSGRFYLALVRFIESDAAGAMLLAGEALLLATELGRPHSRAFAILAHVVLAVFAGREDDALAWSESCIAFSTEQRFAEFLAMATVVRGWAIGRLGDPREGLGLIDHGLLQWDATGYGAWRSWFGLLRSELLLLDGDAGASLDAIAEVERWMEASGERQFASLLATARAAALAGIGAATHEIAAAHIRALEIARDQAAPAWVRRANDARQAWIARLPVPIIGAGPSGRPLGWAYVAAK